MNTVKNAFLIDGKNAKRNIAEAPPLPRKAGVLQHLYGKDVCVLFSDYGFI